MIFFRNFVFFFQNYSITKFVSFRLSFPSKRGTVALTLTCVYISVRTHTHRHSQTRDSHKNDWKELFSDGGFTQSELVRRGVHKRIHFLPARLTADADWEYPAISRKIVFFPRFPLSYRISLQLWHPTERWSLFEGRNLEKKEEISLSISTYRSVTRINASRVVQDERENAFSTPFDTRLPMCVRMLSCREQYWPP